VSFGGKNGHVCVCYAANVTIESDTFKECSIFPVDDALAYYNLVVLTKIRYCFFLSSQGIR